jgi:hypothetical protein
MFSQDFVMVGPRGQCSKTSYIHNLRILVVNYSARPLQSFQTESNKHPRLLEDFEKYGQKSFITLNTQNDKRQGSNPMTAKTNLC